MRLVVTKKQPTFHALPNSSYLENRIGFWGTVIEANAENNTVTVKADTQQVYVGIPVYSREWVSNNDNYVTGSRNLPPIESRVFVLMPTGTITGSFVLCSGYSRGDTADHVLFEKDKENISANKSVGGWLTEENYEEGSINIVNDKETIQLTIDKDDKISLKANDISLIIDKDTINLSIKGDINLETENNLIMKAKKVQINPSGTSASLEVV